MGDKNKYYTREQLEDYLKRIQISGEGGQSDEGIELEAELVIDSH
jgi:hypothetical protein